MIESEIKSYQIQVKLFNRWSDNRHYFLFIKIAEYFLEYAVNEKYESVRIEWKLVNRNLRFKYVKLEFGKWI